MVVGGWGKLARRTGCRFWVSETEGGGGGFGRCEAFTLGACRIGGGGGGGIKVKPLLAKGVVFGTGVEPKVFN